MATAELARRTSGGTHASPRTWRSTRRRPGRRAHGAAAADERLRRDGPNALPAEAAGAGLAAVPRAVHELHADDPGRRGDRVARDQGVEHRASLLLAITLLNAVVGLRQEGKAESAMNALKSMVKATARVRRDGVEAADPRRGGRRRRRRPAGRRATRCRRTGGSIAASSLADRRVRPDRRERPRRQGRRDAARRAALAPGDQTNMAFMHTPVTHGSGVMIVTATGGDTAGREDRRTCSRRRRARRRR